MSMDKNGAALFMFYGIVECQFLANILSRSLRLIRDISSCLITARTGVLVHESASVTVTHARILIQGVPEVSSFNYFYQSKFIIKEFLIFSL